MTRFTLEKHVVVTVRGVAPYEERSVADPVIATSMWLWSQYEVVGTVRGGSGCGHSTIGGHSMRLWSQYEVVGTVRGGSGNVSSPTQKKGIESYMHKQHV